MKQKLTDKQLSVLAFAHDFFRENDQLPNPTALARRMGYRGGNHAGSTRMLAALAAKGYIERNECGGYRFVREAAGGGASDVEGVRSRCVVAEAAA